MRALALADRPFHADPWALADQHRLDAVLCLGDLQPSWLEALDRVRLPKLGVRGNHDTEAYMEQFGIEDLHLRRVELDCGTSVSGFEGCVEYPRGRGDHGPVYSQRKAAKLVCKLPAADVLICHCPPYGVNDDPEDPAHVGFEALRDWVLEHRPRVLLHGHTHPHPGTLVKRLGDTRVVYVSGARVVDLAAGPPRAVAIRPGGPGDEPRLLALFDDAVAWLVARGQTGQWGSEPFSAREANVERARAWAAGGGLWFAVGEDGHDAGAIVLGDAHDYVPPASRPELYVQVLLTAAAWRGQGVGRKLIERACDVGRARGAEQLRVDCWDGTPELPAAYERLGFARVGSFEVRGWPGAILAREL
jgi:uncharacterized protein